MARLKSTRLPGILAGHSFKVRDECLFTVSDFRGYGLGGAALVEHKIVKAVAFALLRSEAVGMFAYEIACAMSAGDDGFPPVQACRNPGCGEACAR